MAAVGGQGKEKSGLGTTFFGFTTEEGGVAAGEKGDTCEKCKSS